MSHDEDVLAFGIETPRLILRPMSETDAPLIVDWRNDPANLALMGLQKPIDLEGHLTWFCARPTTRRDAMIVDKASSATIGTLSITGALDDLRIGGLGKIFSRAQRGKGFAIEATYAWLTFLFTCTSIQRVIAQTLENNGANIRLNSRLGFTFDGTAEDPAGLGRRFVQMQLDQTGLLSSEFRQTVDWHVKVVGHAEHGCYCHGPISPRMCGGHW